MIGQSPRRREDERLLAGRGRFVDDIRLPDPLHVVLVRSTHARARLRRVDVTGARAQPGVLAFAAADLPEVDAPLPARGTETTNPYVVLDTPRPPHVLVRDEVRHVGEAIAAVLAPDPYRAADAAEAVAIEYEPRPAVMDADAAMRDDAPSVHAGQGNVVGRLRTVIGDVDEAFAQAAVVVEDSLAHVRVSSMALEPRAVGAALDADGEHLTVWASHQTPYALRAAIASYLGLSLERVRVLAPDTGGGFGSKIAVYPEDVLVPVLAYLLRRPVKWIQTRTEFMQSSHQAREQRHAARLAATRDGRLLALDVKIVKDVGAYHVFSLSEPTNTILSLPSLYQVPALRAEASSVVTNKVPSSPYRGAGRPEAVLVIERLLDRLARRLGMDPADLRARNLVRPDQMPYAPALVYRDGVPVRYDGGDFPLALRRALELADYDGWRRRQPELRRAGRRVGLGIAAYVDAGGSPSPGEWATVRVDDSGQVAVLIGVAASGQGHETVFAQVCAEHVGARFDDVHVRGGDTALVPHSYGTAASRVAINTGNAVALAAGSVKRKACRVAARLLECDAQDVRIADGKAFVTGAPMRAVPLGRVAQAAARDRSLADLGGPGLWSTDFYALPTVTWASGVHVAVVEVDADTGQLTILKYVMVHDCGRQLHPVIVDGQVMGGFAQGLGVSLGERVVYDDAGQLLTGSLMEYPIPRAADIPDVATEHLEFPTDHNPLGVRGVGEGPACAPAAAVANAIDDAFDGHLAIRDPVLTPACVRALIEQARGRED
jgi:carbon-monoxide dehydrogenase large subunit